MVLGGVPFSLPPTPTPQTSYPTLVGHGILKGTWGLGCRVYRWVGEEEGEEEEGCGGGHGIVKGTRGSGCRVYVGGRRRRRRRRRRGIGFRGEHGDDMG